MFSLIRVLLYYIYMCEWLFSVYANSHSPVIPVYMVIDGPCHQDGYHRPESLSLSIEVIGRNGLQFFLIGIFPKLRPNVVIYIF